MKKAGLLLMSLALSTALWAESPEKKGLDVINSGRFLLPSVRGLPSGTPEKRSPLASPPGLGGRYQADRCFPEAILE